MRVTVASGKGGTGKTTVAVNLAIVAAENGRQVHFLDCDVEEPNAGLFLKPGLTDRRPVMSAVPVIDPDRCAGSGLCAQICQFNALAVIPGEVLVFPELCHSCAGCWLVCPEEAIRPGERRIGTLARGRAGQIHFAQGRLRVGEALVPPLIKQVLACAPADALTTDALTIIDAPPGTSCPVVTAVQDSDYVILVTEPTPFGLNDLVLAVELVRVLQRPFGVVINRADSGDDRVHHYCAEQKIPLLLEIPFRREVAEAYATGQVAVTAVPDLRGGFEQLLQALPEPAPGGRS